MAVVVVVDVIVVIVVVVAVIAVNVVAFALFCYSPTSYLVIFMKGRILSFTGGWG